MTARPCARCGDIIPTGTYCSDCRPKPTPRPRGHIHGNPTKWKALSAKARRLQPWCSKCDATTDLTTDHVIPYSVAPALAYCRENTRILCRSCNSTRGNRCTPEDIQAVIDRLEQSYQRHPTRAGRQHLTAARNALTRGYAPKGSASPPDVKAQGQLHTPRGYGA